MLGEHDTCAPRGDPWWCNRWFWVCATSSLLFMLSYLQLRHQIRICVAGALCFLVGVAITVVRQK